MFDSLEPGLKSEFSINQDKNDQISSGEKSRFSSKKISCELGRIKEEDDEAQVLEAHEEKAVEQALEHLKSEFKRKQSPNTLRSSQKSQKNLD